MTRLVLHIVHRLDFGGLENGLINLVNHMSPDIARHVIVALTEASSFVDRIQRPGTEVIALRKRAGKDPSAYLRLYRMIRRLRPDIVHTRNIGTLDCQFIAFLAGVPHRIHGEHGWDVHDPDGRSPKYRLFRRLFFPFVHRIVALSRELEDYLVNCIGVPRNRILRICNGVDTGRFVPRNEEVREGASQAPFVIGSVTRFSAIKDPLNVVRAFISLSRRFENKGRVRLLMVGDGPLLEDAREAVRQSGLLGFACFPGAQQDPASWYRRMDVFVLGSLREGISNTILEALASGLPVVACDVGGNPELVRSGVTGQLVGAGDPEAIAGALEAYVRNRSLARAHGLAARSDAVERFSLDAMVRRYSELYTEVV